MKTCLWVIAVAVILAAGAAVAEAGHGIVGGVYGRVGTGRAVSPRPYSYNQGFYGGPRSAFQYSSYSGGYGYRGGYHGGSGYQRSYEHGHFGHSPYGRYGYDAGHFDYYPGGHVRHYDHFHYIPPHIDWHEEHHCDD